jgi:hypothetical protein
MIGPAELEDIRLDLQAGSGSAPDTFHPSFHPDAATMQTGQHGASPAEITAAADQPSCVSSNSSELSSGTR